MNEQEFHDLIYDMYYPDAARQEAAKLRYAELDREVRLPLLANVLTTDLDGLVWRAIALLLNDDRSLHLPSILPLFDSEFPGVRYVTCAVLGDGRISDALVAAALLDRLKQDSDCQIRGVAASALGKIGAIEALPDLHQAWQTDREVDELGHTPSDQALDAMTSVLRNWVSGQIQGTPPQTFREVTRQGQLTGTVTAEAIPFDAEGRLDHTSRYARLPRSAFGDGSALKLDMQTSLIAPFEIDVQYVDPKCVIRCLLIYQPISDLAECNWAVHSILNPTAMKSPPEL